VCFVIGCVTPSIDEQSSILVHNGRRWQWRLPLRRKDAIWKKLVPEKTQDDSDDVNLGLAEADWQKMDELVSHWQPKMDENSVRVFTGNRTGQSRSQRLARRRRRP
jgi:hypothetical protein